MPIACLMHLSSPFCAGRDEGTVSAAHGGPEDPCHPRGAAARARVPADQGRPCRQVDAAPGGHRVLGPRPVPGPRPQQQQEGPPGERRLAPYSTNSVSSVFAVCSSLCTHEYCCSRIASITVPTAVQMGCMLSSLLVWRQIGHIKDIGHDPSLPTTRLYATHEAQPYHNDSSDIVGACLTGGLCSCATLLHATCATETMRSCVHRLRICSEHLLAPWAINHC